MIFGCVLFHELCHVMAAWQLGYRVTEIVLLPFGGVAKIDGMQGSGWREVVIVLAGPVGSALCAGICRWLMADGHALVQMMAEINTMLALWNLLPAYPLDGGRMMRILFGYMMTQKKAVGRTASISYVIAAVLLFYAVYEWCVYGEIWVSMIFMAAMIVRLSKAERQYQSLIPLYTMVRKQRALREQGYAPTKWYTVRADMRACDVVELFRPQTYTMIRVVTQEGAECGILSETVIWQGLEKHLLGEAIENFCKREE